MRRRLAEADPRIEGNPLARDAGRQRGVAAFGQEGRHAGDDVVVVVVRRHLHRAGLALHVHQADADGRVGGGHGQRAGRLQRAHVVEDVDAQRERLGHHHRVGRVHRHRHAQRHRMPQHRQHARQLLGGVGQARTRARGFAADVQDVGALRHQQVAVRARLVRVRELAAIEERVGGDVDDAHHPGSRQVDAEAAGLPGRHEGMRSGNEKRGARPRCVRKNDLRPRRARLR